MASTASAPSAALIAAADKRVAVVTGASRGIGLELVRQLLESGEWRVVPTCRSPAEARELLALHEAGRHVGMEAPVQLDVTDAASANRAVEAVSALVPAIQLLINNAAMPNNHDPQDHVLNTAPDAMTELFDVNCTGVLRVTHAFLPLLRAGRGVVANLSSTLGSVSKADSISPGYFTAYRCSKAAMNMLTRTLAAGEPQVTFVLLQPGAVATDMGRAARSTIPGMPPDVVAGIPVDQSVRGMLRVLARDVARGKDSGKNFLCDGSQFAW